MSEAVTRPEFEMVRSDLKALERNYIEMSVVLNRQATDLDEIKGMLRDQGNASILRNKTLRNTVVAANALGPAALGALYALAKTHGWLP